MTPSNTQNRRPAILVMEGLRDAASCVRAAGGDVIIVNPRNVESAEEALAVMPFDGLLLTGGGDVNPKLYGERPNPHVYGVNDARDYTEWAALDAARDSGAAVMGICRGMQMIAVHNGGRLRQHITGHRNTTHLVFAERGSQFKRTIGNAGGFVSLHHQRVLRHGPGMRVAGRDRSGGIEAIESRDGRVLAVQFHPEMDFWRNEQSRALFRWLVIEAAQRSGLPVPKIRRGLEPVAPRASRRRRQLVLPDMPERLPRRAPTRPIASRWFCRDCGMEFDKQQDRDDHEYWICGDPKMRTTEPPPGHPDWIT